MKFKMIASILAVVLLSAGAYGGEDDKEKKNRKPTRWQRGLAGFVQAGTHFPSSYPERGGIRRFRQHGVNVEFRPALPQPT